MKLLLDHRVDRRFAALVVGHEVATAAEKGWQEFRNGQLLAEAAANGFAAFVTTDKNIRHQQKLELLPLTVIELAARDTRFRANAPLAPALLEVLAEVERFRFISIAVGKNAETLAPRS